MSRTKQVEKREMATKGILKWFSSHSNVVIIRREESDECGQYAKCTIAISLLYWLNLLDVEIKIIIRDFTEMKVLSSKRRTSAQIPINPNQ